MDEYILIVDDQPAIRLFLQELFRDAGYQVRAAADGWECLQLVRSGKPPALILLDHQMPSLSGLQVLARLKEEKATQEIPVIMLTSNGEIVDQAKEHGAVEVVVKPPDADQLMGLVSRVLASKSLNSFPTLEPIILF